MKKNIILIDLNLTLLKSVCESEKVNVELLITDANEVELANVKDLYSLETICKKKKSM